MKKEYNDLSIEEKKEYHILKNLTVDIPFSLLYIFLIILCIAGGFLTSKIYASIIFICTFYLTLYYHFDKTKKVKKLFGL